MDADGNDVWVDRVRAGQANSGDRTAIAVDCRERRATRLALAVLLLVPAGILGGLAVAYRSAPRDAASEDPGDGDGV